MHTLLRLSITAEKYVLVMLSENYDLQQEVFPELCIRYKQYPWLEAPQQTSEQSERKLMCKQAGTALSHLPCRVDASPCLRRALSHRASV